MCETASSWYGCGMMTHRAGDARGARGDGHRRKALAPEPFGPLPSTRQLAWHELEMYGFLHFTVNTFTDREWGYGDESPDLFNPSDFSADQIVETAGQAGMAGLILTCKHHDGFCLWPSRYTDHSVRRSPWRRGEGDVVREISDACAARGLRFGVYLSPWDRNHAGYGRPEYLRFFRNQLEELTSEYGDLFEVWFDGANGGDGYYGGARETRRIDRRTYYDWENTWKIVRRNQPNAVMFSDAGPDIRWVGNEDGIAGDPCWATVTRRGLFPGVDDEAFRTYAAAEMVDAWASPRDLLNQGDPNGEDWLPAECDVSIRPGWFYHPAEDGAVRPAGNLFDLYLRSVGRGGSLLLNLPPDRRGRIHETDVDSLRGFRARVDRLFAHNLATADPRVPAAAPAAAPAAVTATSTRGDDPLFGAANLIDGDCDSYWASDELQADVVLDFGREVDFTTVSVREAIGLGQRVRGYAIDVDRGGWREIARGRSIGSRRLVHGERRRTRRIRLRITESAAPAVLRELGVYLDPGA